MELTLEILSKFNVCRYYDLNFSLTCNNEQLPITGTCIWFNIGVKIENFIAFKMSDNFHIKITVA